MQMKAFFFTPSPLSLLLPPALSTLGVSAFIGSLKDSSPLLLLFFFAQPSTLISIFTHITDSMSACRPIGAPLSCKMVAVETKKKKKKNIII